MSVNLELVYVGAHRSPGPHAKSAYNYISSPKDAYLCNLCYLVIKGGSDDFYALLYHTVYALLSGRVYRRSRND